MIRAAERFARDWNALDGGNRDGSSQARAQMRVHSDDE